MAENSPLYNFIHSLWPLRLRFSYQSVSLASFEKLQYASNWIFQRKDFKDEDELVGLAKCLVKTSSALIKSSFPEHFCVNHAALCPTQSTERCRITYFLFLKEIFPNVFPMLAPFKVSRHTCTNTAISPTFSFCQCIKLTGTQIKIKWPIRNRNP